MKPPAFLMLDDVGPLLVGPHLEGDWGFLGELGTWRFFLENYKREFPDLTVVLFAPARRLVNYNEPKLPFWEGGRWARFLREVANKSWVEVAFHGVSHGFLEKGRYIPEMERVEDPLSWLKEGKSILEDITGREVLGGKAPAWVGDERAIEVAKKAGFRWWAWPWAPVQGFRRLRGGARIARRHGITLLPGTLGAYSGRYFKGFRKAKHLIRLPLRKVNLLRYADYLIKRGMPLFIQCHYAALRADGRHQAYNIYDDLGLLKALLKHIDGRVSWTLPRYLSGA